MNNEIQDNIDRARAATARKVKSAAKGIRKSVRKVNARAKAASEGAGETIGAAKLKEDKAAMEATRVITEHPLAAVAAAAAVGALVASFLPRLFGRSDNKAD